MSPGSLRNAPRSLAAVLLLLLFVGMSLGSIRHAHSAAEIAARGEASNCADGGLHGCVAVSDHDCGLCDFAARLVAPPEAVVAAVPLPVLESAPAAAHLAPPASVAAERHERTSCRAPPATTPFSFPYLP